MVLLTAASRLQSPLLLRQSECAVQPHWNQVWGRVVNIANIAWARNTAWFPRVQRVQPTERSIVETCGELCSGCVTHCVTYVCIVPVKHKHTQQTHVTNKYDISLHSVCFGQTHATPSYRSLLQLLGYHSRNYAVRQFLRALHRSFSQKRATVEQNEVTNCDRLCERNVITALCNENCNCCTKCSRHKFWPLRIVATVDVWTKCDHSTLQPPLLLPLSGFPPWLYFFRTIGFRTMPRSPWKTRTSISIPA